MKSLLITGLNRDEVIIYNELLADVEIYKNFLLIILVFFVLARCCSHNRNK